LYFSCYPDVGFYDYPIRARRNRVSASIIKSVGDTRLDEVFTVIENIVEKYHNKPWSWNALSRNPNITMDDVEQYPNAPWSWNELSRNPSITMNNIEKYHTKINWNQLSANQFNKCKKLRKIKIKIIERSYASYRWRQCIKYAALRYRLKQEIECYPRKENEMVFDREKGK